MRLRSSVLATLALFLTACPIEPNDDDTTAPAADDDDATGDDDDSAPVGDDDDSAATGDDDDATSAVCADDHLEDNDSFELAHELAFGDDLEDLVACAGDDDWFSIDVPSGFWLFFDTYHAHGDGNVDLELYDENGDLVDTSTSETDDERVGFFLPEGGLYVARVTLAGEGDDVPGGLYELAPGLCRPDWYEPNEVEADAHVFDGSWSEFNLTICGESTDDWYLLQNVAPPQLIDLRLIFLGRDGDFDMYLYGPDGDLVAQGLNEFPVETVLHTVTDPGDYALQIHLDPDLRTPGHKYDMDIELGTAPGDCLPDDFEPNDVLEDARDIAPTIYEDFTICQGEDDWFSIPASSGDFIDLTVDFFHAEGNVDLFLYDSAGVEVAFADSLDDDEFLSHFVAADETFYARVTIDPVDDGGFTGNFYGLVLEGTTGVCIVDIFEPNDSPEEALFRTNGDWRDLHICLGEEDWYELNLNWLEYLTVDVGYILTEGNVDGFLYDSDLNLVASGTNPIDNDHFEWLVTETGTYYLKVIQVVDDGEIEGNVYDFGILSIISTSCSPDSWEPNNSIGSPTAIYPGNNMGLTVCETDPDFFVLEAVSGGIEVDAFFDASEGNIDLRIYDPDGTLVATADSTDDDESLEANGGANPGDWILEVFVESDPTPDSQSNYDLLLAY